MIKGFFCPEKKKNLSFSTCLTCALNGKNGCSFDYPILSAMQANIRKGRGISVSSLLGCLRKVVLEVRNDVYLEPGQLYYAFRGQLFHSVIAKAHAAGCICEKRFERKIAGIPVSGHPDVIYPDKKKLVDYKSTRRVPKDKTPYADHDLQVNLYRYLVIPYYRIDDLEIVYFDMSNVKKVKVEVMDKKELLSWLIPRIISLKDALRGGCLPERVEEERFWQCRGYCPFTMICWPKGVPKSKRVKKS